MNIYRIKPLALKRKSFVKNELKFIKYSDTDPGIRLSYYRNGKIINELGSYKYLSLNEIIKRFGFDEWFIRFDKNSWNHAVLNNFLSFIKDL